MYGIFSLSALKGPKMLITGSVILESVLVNKLRTQFISRLNWLNKVSTPYTWIPAFGLQDLPNLSFYEIKKCRPR